MRWKQLALTVIATLFLLPAPLTAQQDSVGVGGGWDENRYVQPGLEARTPSAEPINPDDVPIMIPHDDQLRGRISIPDDRLGVLVQPDGRVWRSFRIQGLFWIATAAIGITVLALGAFFLWRGRIRIEAGRSGRWVPRFNWVERFTHWLTAVSFLALALTGLVITFGRYLLIPLMGHYSFNTLAEASKVVHNAAGAPFIIGIVLMAGLWVRDNIPNRTDLIWLKKAGGMFSGPGTPHPEAERFNAGQKIIFWVVILGGLAVSVTGLALLLPFFVSGITGMQIAHALHGVIAALLIAVIIAHIYLGTLGMEGAFDAMGRGEVDENWAKEHHSGWYDTEFGSRRPSSPPAAAPESPQRSGAGMR
ncbi:formate dehydrogenase subunit gamma [Plastorhodobacter daqingensis]|uniref:Formate dehydrogenase subunit gamma n=1 Tax=Plastorhodobacter daqingensis TaxID=1387281 RepID=A0ABW2UME9_9RHOB